MRLINKTYYVKGVFDIEGSKKHPARLQIGQGVVFSYQPFSFEFNFKFFTKLTNKLVWYRQLQAGISIADAAKRNVV